ncbi:DUF4143 domain-containing protein [bacterium]|nr:DUF4143 domain-containing protein [bacterium]
MDYIRRTLESVVKNALPSFPVTVLTGPRQSGKTTLLQHLFADTHAYVSLDLPDLREAARDDPRGFLDLFPPPVIFDEAQAVPELFPCVRERVDEQRDRNGQYILTGSQNFQLLPSITESLAGRAAILHLFPFTQAELAGEPNRDLPWHRARRNVAAVDMNHWDRFVTGYYPEPAVRSSMDTPHWRDSYIQTYLERDVRTLSGVGDLAGFRDFLRVTAGRSGSLLNYSELAREMGLTVNTIKSWMGVLQASFQVFILHPYHTNIGKELTKTPKLYMTDAGLMCALLGLTTSEDLLRSTYAGAVLETAVVNEIRKRIAHTGQRNALHFWRTAAGTEVDLLVEAGQEQIAVEVKKTATPRAKHASSLRTLMNDLPDRVKTGYLLHSGEETLPLAGGVTALPYGVL